MPTKQTPTASPTPAAETKNAQFTVNPGVATGTKGTMPLHIWLHEVKLAAIHGGADAEWLNERFGHRLVGWFDVGESVAGAVEMVLFCWKREPIETRGETEAEHLKDFLRAAVEEVSR